MNTEEHNETDGAQPAALSRADVELLCARNESTTSIDLSFQNLQECNLSYLNLQGVNLRGANLRGADLRGADLRGVKLSDANLQEADLSECDLDGADLSRAHMGENDSDHVNLRHAKLCFALLRDLDLRNFDLSELDLQNADLRGTDLRGALLRQTMLCGADLSTALLHASQLRGAILHHNTFAGNQSRTAHVSRKPYTLRLHKPALAAERSPSASSRAIQPLKIALTDRAAYLLGAQSLLADADPVKIQRLFPEDFTFAHARQIFDSWLARAEKRYNTQELQAIWIGFAHRICDLYYENESAP
ncbi:MAG TPA: pentapeptide repeat-containing protein [Ktedonobacteraceae bacterium]|jgi:uncharacterized protein YjbI with pentapeptide repeats